LKPRAPRPNDRWRVKAELVEAITEFADESVEELMAEQERPDMYRAIAAILLLERKGEAATAASVASVVGWEIPRARLALAALEERRIAVRLPAKRRRAGDLFEEAIVAKAAIEAEPAGNPLDPRLDESEASN